MARSKKPAAPASVPVDAHKHPTDKRPNIPTRETAPFAIDAGPQTFVVHRDRSLDPQLVWKGKDEQDEDLTRQPEQVKAFRDTWELGIHSYLSYMRDRLAAARDLLTESGSIFVQIGDDNVHLVRSLLDEVFGGENAISFITFKKTT